MKILQLCKKFPFPINDGESIANVNLSKGLTKLGHSVVLFALNTTKDPYQGESKVKALGHYAEIHSIPIDNRLKIWPAIQSLLMNRSYHISRFDDDHVRSRLVSILTDNTFDIVHMESIYFGPYLDVISYNSKAKIVLRTHNVEYKIWERAAQTMSFGIKKWYILKLSQQLKRYEQELINQFDALIAMSPQDLNAFKTLGLSTKSHVLGIGLDLANYKVEHESKNPNSLCFIGSLDWQPNLDGLNWFLNDIWPLAHERFPNLTFHIAGKNTPESIKTLKVPNVIVHGQVAQAIAFINAHDMMIVPLRSGSGLRVKILEAMALSKSVISTSIGAEGIGAIHVKHLMIANKSSEILDSISHLLQNQKHLNQLGEGAYKFVHARYSIDNIAKELEEVYNDLIH